MTDDFELEEPIDEEIREEIGETEETENATDDIPKGRFTKLIEVDDTKKHLLSGMYKDWFLDYASYVILERAVPHINDGLKPVQRRILHAMKNMDDGRFNKVANIIGSTMQYHPHGDASIGDALVQLGQKDLLIETQGNWGNILTGDNAAAPRYIEARLSKFAHDVAFNHKTTQWMPSYDGRNNEPVTLPMKFPLLLSQGVDGIAVGLASKILPHNFNELIDASIAYLQSKDFELYPDFPTSGYIDCSRYNDGLRGGAVKVRAKIVKGEDFKTLVITNVPYGKTTSVIIESILKANEKGRIKIKKVDDNTSKNVEIVVHLANDTSPDKTIDALYAFTDCEISISPNSCVIVNKMPMFLSVTEILKRCTDSTKQLLKQELEIRMNELFEDWHYSSLEKIFFEQRIYRELEKDTKTWEDQLDAIELAFKPYQKNMKREVTRDDVLKLTDKPVRRISKFDIKKADEHIKNVEFEIDEVQNNLDNLIDYAVTYFRQIKKKYGKGRERKTEIMNFDIIQASQVVVANEKLYVNRAEGFVGTGLKKDEYVGECSDVDDIIVFLKNGKYLITKVAEKTFVGKEIIHVGVFKRNDDRTIYNAAYRDGKNGAIMIKRFAVTSVTRDREYDLTKGTAGSQVLYFSANPNGEAETLKVYFKPRPRLKNLITELDFGTLAIKGRQSIGNIFTKYAIHKIVLKEKGESTLSGRQIWFDESINRLNVDGRGILLGEFAGDDKILVVTKQGAYFTTNFDLSNRYDEDILSIEKYNPDTVFSATYFDSEQKYFYVKRFKFEISIAPQRFIDENQQSYLVEISHDEYPQIEMTFKGKHAKRLPEIIDVEEFIGVKTSRAKGKRISTFDVDKVRFIAPLEKNPKQNEPDNNKPTETDDSKAVQMSLL
ncbi:MAG: DNA gyrase/topoisomerase IV subunit A [Prevotellaceae bacterium]|jgi:topoisomerase-4 subunit A|nr:DNA gyrase/topoisomerase IV subunit A [Prevotellaceae bacterium]